MLLSTPFIHDTLTKVVNHTVEDRVLSLSCHVPVEKSQEFQSIIEKVAGDNNLTAPGGLYREPKLRYSQEFINATGDVQLFVTPDANSDSNSHMEVTTIPLSKLLEEAQKFRDKNHYFNIQTVYVSRLNKNVDTDSLVETTRKHLADFCAS